MQKAGGGSFQSNTKFNRRKEHKQRDYEQAIPTKKDKMGAKKVMQNKHQKDGQMESNIEIDVTEWETTNNSTRANNVNPGEHINDSEKQTIFLREKVHENSGQGDVV